MKSLLIAMGVLTATGCAAYVGYQVGGRHAWEKANADIQRLRFIISQIQTIQDQIVRETRHEDVMDDFFRRPHGGGLN